MSVCHQCWLDAHKRSFCDTSKSQYEHYRDLLLERASNPCSTSEPPPRTGVDSQQENEHE